MTEPTEGIEMSGRTTVEEDEATILGVADRHATALAEIIELYPLPEHVVVSRFNSTYNRKRAEINKGKVSDA